MAITRAAPLHLVVQNVRVSEIMESLAMDHTSGSLDEGALTVSTRFAVPIAVLQPSDQPQDRKYRLSFMKTLGKRAPQLPHASYVTSTRGSQELDVTR